MLVPLPCAMTTGLEARHPVLAGVHISGFHDRWPLAGSKFGHGSKEPDDLRMLFSPIRAVSCCPDRLPRMLCFVVRLRPNRAFYPLHILQTNEALLPPAGPLPTALYHRKVGSLRGDVNAEMRRSTRAGGGGAIGARCVDGNDVLSVGRGGQGGQEGQQCK